MSCDYKAIRRMRKNRMVKTELFDYTKTEYAFVRNTDSTYIRHLIDTKEFRSINSGDEYKGKNREYHSTVGEFFILSCVKKIFNSFSRVELIGWINIFSELMNRGYLSREIMNRVVVYISQKRMPVMMRCIVRIIMNKYFLILKRSIQAEISTKYYIGVDSMIASYVLC